MIQSVSHSQPERKKRLSIRPCRTWWLKPAFSSSRAQMRRVTLRLLASMTAGTGYRSHKIVDYFRVTSKFSMSEFQFRLCVSFLLAVDRTSVEWSVSSSSRFWRTGAWRSSVKCSMKWCMPWAFTTSKPGQIEIITWKSTWKTSLRVCKTECFYSPDLSRSNFMKSPAEEINAKVCSA